MGRRLTWYWENIEKFFEKKMLGIDSTANFISNKV